MIEMPGLGAGLKGQRMGAEPSSHVRTSRGSMQEITPDVRWLHVKSDTLIRLRGWLLEQRGWEERREVAKGVREEDVSEQNGDKRSSTVSWRWARQTQAIKDQSELQKRDWALACGSHGIFDA
jgi:hypothetical protein